MSLVNMVISDTLCGYVSILSYGAHSLNSGGIDYFWCYYSSAELISFLGLSISSATLISVERYFHIVLGKTATFRVMLRILISLWVLHFAVGFYPLMVNMDVVSQASETYCLPDFRRSDILHRSYGIVVVAFIILVLTVITACYLQIWKKAVADGFRWNEKSFVMRNGEQPNADAPVGQTVLMEPNPNTKSFSSHSIKTSSSVVTSSRYNPPTHIGTLPTEARDATARIKQMAMTKKLGVITLALYLAWLGNLVSFLYQMSTGIFLDYTWDAFLGIFHFCHCIFNPLIILTMDSRWKFRLNGGEIADNA